MDALTPMIEVLSSLNGGAEGNTRQVVAAVERPRSGNNEKAGPDGTSDTAGHCSRANRQK